MISEFQGKRRIFTFPKAWANAVVRWIAGVHSPNGTMEISNTLNPGDDGSLGLDVNLDAVVDKVKVRLGFDKRSPLDRNDVRDIVFDLLDGASVINSGRRVAVNLDWLNANIGQGEGGGAVSSVNGKTGAVVLTYTDVGAASSDDLDTVSESLEELIDVVDGIVADYLSSADIGVTVAAVDHTHDGYAAAEHTHTGYAASDHNHTGVYAAYSHTHDGYAASNHNHNGVYATVSHTHSGYAASNHNHSGVYATENHTHGFIDSIGELKKYSGTSLVNANDAVVGTSSSGYIGAIDGMLATGLKKIYDAFTISTSDAKLAVAKVDFGSGVTNVTSSNLASQAATAGLLTQDVASGLYAALEHTHTEYAASDHDHNGVYASISSVETLTSTVSGIVSNYVTSAALSSALAGYSPVGHGHSGYAAASHTHSGYAESSHTHTASNITDFATKVKSYIPDCYESRPVEYTGAVSAYVMMYLNGTIGYGQLSIDNFSGTASKLYGTNSSGTFSAVASLLTSAPSSDKVLTVKSGGTAITWEDAGGGSPSNPSSKTTANITSEGTATANTTSWTYSDTTAKGMQLTVCSRVFYDHTASTPVLYGFYRTWTFDTKGRLYSISAETRYEIDTPVVGNLTT